MEFSTHPVFGIWIQPLGSRSSFWDLDAVFGIWIQSLGSGCSLWDLDAVFGMWIQPLECGFNLWDLDPAFGIWIQSHTLVWDLWARGADPVSSSTSRILEFAAQPGEPQGWHLRVLLQPQLLLSQNPKAICALPAVVWSSWHKFCGRHE